MKILVLSEVSDSRYRVGREAQILSLAELLQARGHSIVLASSNQDFMRPNGLSEVETLKLMSLPENRVEKNRLISEIESYLIGDISELDLGTEAEISLLQEQIAATDAVIIAGSSPMSSYNPGPLYERVLLAALARSVRRPVIFTNQIIGSTLHDAEEKMLVSAYQKASHVGISSEASQEWCTRHGVRATPNVDLSTLFSPKLRSLASSARYDYFKAIGELPNAFVGVTLGDLPANLVNTAAATFDRLHRETGLCTVFIPHETSPKLQDGDSRVHRDVAARMWSPTLVLPAVHADVAAGLHHIAAFNVSTSPRVASLALGKGIPTFGFYATTDTRASFTSILTNFDLQDFLAPIQLIGGESVFEALRELANRFENYQNLALTEQTQRLRDFAQSWWNTADDALSARAQGDLPLVPLPESLVVPEGSFWRGRLKSMNSALDLLMQENESMQVSREVTAGQTKIVEQERDFALRRNEESQRIIEEQSLQIARLTAELAEAKKPSGWGRLFGAGR